MNRWQKIAWFNLVVIASALLSSAAAIAILVFRAGFPKALAGFGCLGLAGFMGLSPLLFHKDKSKVSFDERDALFAPRAALGGFGSSYCFFIAFFVAALLILGLDGSVPVTALGIMVCGGLITHSLVWSIAILVQYSRGGKNGAD